MSDKKSRKYPIWVMVLLGAAGFFLGKVVWKAVFPENGRYTVIDEKTWRERADLPVKQLPQR
jgi:hypothetical protein